MKKIIKNKLHDKFNINENYGDKWTDLEEDLKTAIGPVIEKHASRFGPDSYAVIDAIQDVFDNMFQKVR